MIFTDFGVYISDKLTLTSLVPVLNLARREESNLSKRPTEPLYSRIA
jgi:hypothetical protein